MSDTPDTRAIEVLHERRRALELERAVIAAKLEELDELLSLLQDGRRRPRRRNTALEVVAPPAPAPDDAA